MPSLPETKIETQAARQARADQSRRKDLFLKGPIPLWWISRAGDLGLSALKVGLALWFRAGLARSGSKLRVTNSKLTVFGLSTRSVQRGLRSLEEAGLVLVSRTGTRAITIVDEIEKRHAPDSALGTMPAKRFFHV